jgi:hypothetical protein
VTNNCFCGRPAPDAWLCHQHDAELEQLVTELPAMVGYLNDTIGRQVRFSSGRIGGRPADEPVMINEAAARVSLALRNEAVRIIRHLIEARGLSPRNLPNDDLLSIAQWLAKHVQSIRQDETAGDTVQSLRAINRRIIRIIDRPADRIYAGICSIEANGQECPQELYAERGATFIRCRGCGYNHEVERRRDVLKVAARDTLMTIPELKTALPEVLGVPIKDGTLRQWKARKRIVAHGLNWDGKELFRVGDILDIAVDQQRGEAS